MGGTAGNNEGVDYAPDFKNSTLNSGEQQRVKSGQKNPFFFLKKVLGNETERDRNKIVLLDHIK